MKHKKYWLITSLVTLLPILFGLLYWDQLPDRIPTHFGIDGAADGWSGKAFAVFGLPLLMLLFHGVIYAATRLDKQNQGHNAKVLNLTGLIFPMMSIVMSVFIYSRAVEIALNPTSILFPLLGLFFIALGNWLPKIKQNTTLGIKIKWTLYNEENWNKTHRFGGWCWCFGGLLFCLMGFVPENALFLLLPLQLVLLGVAPMVYSWLLAKKQQREGTWTESEVNKKLKQHPVIMAVSLAALVIILGFVAFIMFTGNIEYTCTDTALLIDADFHNDSTVLYETIDAIEFRETAPVGTREFGFASARLLMGWFDNDEFGGHTRYSYVGTDACIIVRCGDDVLILNAETEAATRALWETLTANIPEAVE